MRTEDSISGSQVLRYAHRCCFLSNAEVDRSANHAQFPHLCELLLDKPDVQHRSIHVTKRLRIPPRNTNRPLVA